MTDQKPKTNEGRTIMLTFMGIALLGLLIALLLQGTDIALFNPKGHIAWEEYKLMLLTAAMLFGIAIPTLTVLYFFAWKYRETNAMPTSKPVSETRHSKLFVFSIWAIPCAVMALLAVIMWTATHRLDPKKAIAADTRPMTVQVVAMRWKWLFIYPEQRIATVNFVQIPTGTPVRFDLTADNSPMSSFWIPHLSGQLYAMTGHVNQLNLIADTPGDYPGSTPEINGSGFADMKFTVKASSSDAFNQWVRSVQSIGGVLDDATYELLLKPTENHPITLYAQTDSDIYESIVQKYTGSHGRTTNHSGGH